MAVRVCKQDSPAPPRHLQGADAYLSAVDDENKDSGWRGGGAGSSYSFMLLMARADFLDSV